MGWGSPIPPRQNQPLFSPLSSITYQLPNSNKSLQIPTRAKPIITAMLRVFEQVSRLPSTVLPANHNPPSLPVLSQKGKSQVLAARDSPPQCGVLAARPHQQTTGMEARTTTGCICRGTHIRSTWRDQTCSDIRVILYMPLAKGENWLVKIQLATVKLAPSSLSTSSPSSARCWWKEEREK